MVVFSFLLEVGMAGTFLLAMLAAIVAPAPQPASAEKQTSGSLLAIEAIEVDPPQPGPETLCRLKVRLRNNGQQTASDFAFQVALNGQALSVYSNQSWVANLAPGKDTEVQLYNFWTSESDRPAPKDGRLVVEVRLKAARWLDTNEKGLASRPAKDVDPLPAPRSVTLSVSTKKGH